MRSSLGRLFLLKYITIAVLLTGFLAAQAHAPTAPPPRKVEGNTITSTSDPAARIELRNTPAYVGTDRWILYDIANCELHVILRITFAWFPETNPTSVLACTSGT